MSSVRQHEFKGTRAHTYGLESTYQKYNLEMSPSQEMACSMSDF